MGWDWSGAGEGAIGGAVAGGAVGGPWGAVAGGIGGGVLGGLSGGTDRSENAYTPVDPHGKLGQQSREAAMFANQAEQGFGAMGKESIAARQHLADQMRGKNSLSAEQLRQGLQQQLAMQQSMAASARPANAAMAARTAMIQGGRAASGLAGQQAMAGIAERNAAAQNLNTALSQQRALEMQAAIQGRANSIQGYSNIENERTARFTGKMQQPTQMERYMGAAKGGLEIWGMAKGKGD
jgi:hypothetical protein